MPDSVIRPAYNDLHLQNERKMSLQLKKCSRGGKFDSLLRISSGFLSAILLVACASGPIETDEAMSNLSVEQVRGELTEKESLDALGSESVLWGGVILNTQNLTDITQIEIMAYPLDRRQRPMLGREPEGRFLANYDGFLEPVDYAEGRSVSVLGQITGITGGTVGEAEYQYPTISTSQIHLWSADELANKPRVSFGIGVNIGL